MGSNREKSNIAIIVFVKNSILGAPILFSPTPLEIVLKLFYRNIVKFKKIIYAKNCSEKGNRTYLKLNFFVLWGIF